MRLVLEGIVVVRVLSDPHRPIKVSWAKCLGCDAPLRATVLGRREWLRGGAKSAKAVCTSCRRVVGEVSFG